MRIIVATTHVPFTADEGAPAAKGLIAALREAAHLVDLVDIPVTVDVTLWTQYALAIRCLDLTEVSGNRIDLLITLSLLANYLDHPRKIVWWRLAENITPDTQADHRLQSQRTSLREAQKVYTVSTEAGQVVKRIADRTPDGILVPPIPNVMQTQGITSAEWHNVVMQLTT